MSEESDSTGPECLGLCSYDDGFCSGCGRVLEEDASSPIPVVEGKSSCEERMTASSETVARPG